MKNMRKLLAMVLAVIMVMSLATTAFAAEADLTGHQYKAYQIFKGTQAEGQDELGQVEWGDGINAEAFLNALKADETFGETFDACQTAADVAGAMKGWADKSAEAKAFAALAYENKAGEGIACENGVTTLDAGYYLVVDVTVNSGNADNFVYNTALLQLTNKGTFEITNKTDVPEVDKVIVGSDNAEASTVEIGETVNFKFTGTMPTNIADYDTYYYVFNDTMSAGLTYAGNLKVTVNGVVVTDYFYSNSEAILNTAGATLKVGMQDILALENLTDPSVGEITDGTTVVVTYDAIVNEDAQIGVDGETNKVDLTYSNNPNEDGDGTTNPPPTTPDEPTPNVPTGETPEDVVKVYSAEIKLTKVDGDTETILTGAKFSISGISSNVKVINKEMFVENANGTYYRLKDGTYTTTAPTDENRDSYESTSVKYQKVEVVTTETVKENFVAEGWVDQNGVITFTGLGAGTYTITELVAPDGYNKLTTPITVVISATVPEEIVEGSEKVTWTATVNGTSATVNNGVVEYTVENNAGSTLPETGGMGTTLFYIVGGIMVAAAAVLLVTKRRMNMAE